MVRLVRITRPLPTMRRLEDLPPAYAVYDDDGLARGEVTRHPARERAPGTRRRWSAWRRPAPGELAREPSAYALGDYPTRRAAVAAVLALIEREP